jgi:prolyl-tRNA synthetase
MRYSQLFGKTKKGENKKYEAINQELLIKAGFIDQVASGIYTILPLGKRVIEKIIKIIKEEHEKINAQEIVMPLLHPKSFWQQTNRWETVDVLFKTKSQYGGEYGLAPTHEEIVTPLAKKFIQSYRNLPLALYHITTKFRDEPRPKSGILRGREFIMKDLYSFHETVDDLKSYYKKVTQTYINIFERVGFEKIKITEASGGSFSKKFSHEFNVLTPAGEVNLFYCDNCQFAQNQEVSTVVVNDRCPRCKKGKINFGKAIEIGNIFDLGTRFSEAFELTFIDKDGKNKYIYMGCYGIGITRIVGALIEIHHDKRGIIWPKTVAPFTVHLVALDLRDVTVRKKAERLYKELVNKGIEVLYDDREEVSAGEKLIDADLIGVPIRLLISRKTGDKVELKKRNEDKISLLETRSIPNYFT